MSHAGVSPSINDEPEYRTAEELVVAQYAITHSDMAGFCAWNPLIVSAGCRISKRKVGIITSYFEQIGKLVTRGDRLYIWWRSKIYYSFYKGRGSADQLSNIQKILRKLGNSGGFSSEFLGKVQVFYETKYDIDLQLFVNQQPKGGRVWAKSESEAITKSKAVTKSEDSSSEQNSEAGFNEFTDDPAFRQNLSMQSGDWGKIFTAHGAGLWMRHLLSKFTRDLIEATAKSISEYYSSKALLPSGDIASQRQKFVEWCERDAERGGRLNSARSKAEDSFVKGGRS